MVSSPLHIPSILQLDYTSITQHLAVSACLCFDQILDEGSRMAIDVVINLDIGEGIGEGHKTVSILLPRFLVRVIPIDP